MELNKEWLAKARAEFRASGDDNLAEAIEAYLAEMFKPGQVQMLEPPAAIPQRDYRKELWIAAFASGGRTDRANQALADFDKTFPPENTHG